MNKNKKIAIFALLSFFLPIIGIPLLIMTVVKANEEQVQKNVVETKAQEIVDVNKEESDNVEIEIETTENSAKGTYKIPKKKLQTFIIIGAIALVFMILGVILALTVGSVGNTLLLLTGTIEIIAAIVIFVIEHRRVLYTCPECGTKREQHIELVDTKTNVKGQKTNLYRSSRDFIDCTITSYMYRYKYTYVCPKCGKTTTEYHSENGGNIYQYVDGIVINKVKTPKSK